VLELASATRYAADVQAHDPSVASELAYWTGPAAPEGTGLPPAVLPEQPAETAVAGRDYGRTGTLSIGAGHDRAAVYALLFGDTDEPRGWLASGEGLSAAWLTATALGVSMVPLSDVVEVVYTRQTLRSLFLAELGYPHLVLRVGVAEARPSENVGTPRLAAAQVMDASTELLAQGSSRVG
jgi:hypothetical protein